MKKASPFGSGLRPLYAPCCRTEYRLGAGQLAEGFFLLDDCCFSRINAHAHYNHAFVAEL